MTSTPGKSLPRQGHVSALRQGWAVQEDLGLAERMQQVEVSQHYGGNKVRNRQIREDMPQARVLQSQEERRKQEEEQEHRRRMQQQEERDQRLALELAGGRKDSYTARRDEQFARNLQRIEAEYRERQAREEEVSYPGPQYQDEQYVVEVARPVTLTEEPLYMNQRKEVGEADLWGKEGAFHHGLVAAAVEGAGSLAGAGDEAGAFHLGVTNCWARNSEAEILRTTLVARGFLGVDINSHSGHSTLNSGHSGQETMNSHQTLSGHNTSTDTAGTVTTTGRSSHTSTSSRGTAGSSGGSGSELGACGGQAVISAEELLGPCSLLSPAELRAAEAAEREFEQERRDGELARRLQAELGSGGQEEAAREEQDRQYARALQEREKAKAKRARERARQRKVERQREELGEQGAAGGRIEEQEGALSSRSPRSPDIQPPSRKPYLHATAIDSHTNDTYCTRQITPEHSDSEPQYANIGRDGQPVAEEPILHVPTSKEVDGHLSPRQTSVLDTDMPIPPYMPMQSSVSKKSASLERKIKKKKEKEGCKQQ